MGLFLESSVKIQKKWDYTGKVSGIKKLTGAMSGNIPPAQKSDFRLQKGSKLKSDKNG